LTANNASEAFWRGQLIQGGNELVAANMVAMYSMLDTMILLLIFLFLLASFACGFLAFFEEE